MPTFAELWEQPEPAAPPPQPSRFAKPVAEPTTASFANLWETVPETPERKVNGFGDYARNIAQQRLQEAKSLARSAASLGDILVGDIPATIAGQVTYPFLRAAQQSPEEATKNVEQLFGRFRSPFGNLFGVTQTPEYQNEASRGLMDFISQNISKGADWISANTNIPKADVENMIGSLTMGAPELARMGKQAGVATYQAGKQVVQPVVSAAKQEAKLITGTPNIESKRAEMGYGTQSGRVSAGAANVLPSTEQAALLDQMLPNVRQEIQKIPENMRSARVMQNHAAANSLPVPIELTKGQATQNPKTITFEHANVQKFPEIGETFKRQSEALAQNFDALRDRIGPDIYATTPTQLGDVLIGDYKALDAARQSTINEAYQKLRDTAGGDLLIDTNQFLSTADAALKKGLKSEFLPTEIERQINSFRGENGAIPMTFEQFEALRTNLAAATRKAERAGDGNAAQALSIVRQSLEDMPLVGETANLKQLADVARGAARERFQLLDKDPAYKAAVNDAVAPDDFVKKFVIGGKRDNTSFMVQHLGENSPGHQAMQVATLDYLKNQALGQTNQFAQASFNKALRGLEDRLPDLLPGDVAPTLKQLGSVAKLIKVAPEGSAISRSGTTPSLLSQATEGAANVAEQVVNAQTQIPVATIFRGKLKSLKGKQEVKKSLEPGAGTRLEDIGKE